MMIYQYSLSLWNALQIELSKRSSLKRLVDLQIKGFLFWNFQAMPHNALPCRAMVEFTHRDGGAVRVAHGGRDSHFLRQPPPNYAQKP